MNLRPSRHPPPPRSPVRNPRGQTIILVAVMVLSFLMFFGFTLNTGLLINAKISVQAAADAAAYAGAATQARQLNAISYLNYDMRRQFKKFLFRNVVTGSLGNPEFPKNHDNTFNSPYDFPKFDFAKPLTSNNMPQKVPLRVPVVCIPVVAKTNDDQCVKLNVRDTAFDLQDRLGSLATAGGSIIQTLLGQVKTLQSVQEKTCGGQAAVNQLAVILWLFRGNTDDNLVQDQVNQMLSGGENAGSASQVTETLKGLVKGLGLYPRNILHLMRIRTLESFLNEEPRTVTREDALSMEKNTRIAESRERTLLAFKSALSNLNTTVFSPDETVMEELQPAPLFKLDEPVTADVDVFIQALKLNKSNVGGTICNSHVYNFPALKIPVGVRVASTGRNVFYAVKVRAKVRPRGLLFMPSGESLELEAVAGAKPFGSRIGPAKLSGADFILNGAPKDLSAILVNGEHICKPDQAVNHECNIPNIEIFNGSSGVNFFYTEFLKELMDKINKNPGSTASITTANIIKAQYYAMAPNPREIGHYNIIPPPSAKEGQPPTGLAYEFIPTYDGRERPAGTDFVPPAYRFYAPIYRADSSVDVNTYIENFLKQSLPNTLPNQYGLSGELVRTQTRDALQDYIKGPLTQGTGSELRETLTFAAVEHPMAWLEPAKSPFWLTQASEVLSSWGPENSPRGYQRRFGYSVRFVALRDLMAQVGANQDTTLDSVSH
jgi:hypothetical protein